MRVRAVVTIWIRGGVKREAKENWLSRSSGRWVGLGS